MKLKEFLNKLKKDDPAVKTLKTEELLILLIELEVALHGVGDPGT